MYKLFEIVLDFFFPPACSICGKIYKGYLCEECKKEIEKYKIKTNIRSERFHLLVYEDLIREKMIQYKFYDNPYLYHFFYEILINDKSACEFLKSYDIIIPDPIHNKRKWKRGYNQSSLIAKEVSKKLDIMYEVNCLKKIINTAPQSKMNKEARSRNAKDVYIVKNEQKIINKNVLIFDDIYTTGATANECKKILKQHGANKVGIITIAKD